MTNKISRPILKNIDNKKIRYRRRIIIICLLILVILFAGFVYNINVPNYSSYKIVNSIPNKDNAYGYISYGSGIMKYSMNGAVTYNEDFKAIWNSPYEMKNPIADVCGKYAVIADKGGNLLKIFNEKKCVGSITTLYDIVKVAIASQGVAAVQMSDDNNNYVQFYYEDGSVVLGNNQENMLVDIKKDINNFGCLIDIALSQDGKKLVLDYLSFTTGKLLGTLGFYNFGEVGQNNVDCFVGGYPFEDQVIPRIVFLSNDIVCAFKDNGFLLYSMLEVPGLVYEKTFQHKIKSIIYNEKYAGVVLEEETSSSKQVLLYDLKGRKVLDKKLHFEYNKILLSKDEIIMYNNTTCYIINSNGKEKFDHTFEFEINTFLPTNYNNKYIIVSDSEISEIELSK